MHTLRQPPVPPRNGQRHQWCGLEHSASALAISQHIQKGGTSLVIVPSMAEAERIAEDISIFLKGSDAEKQLHVFPDWETLPYDNFSPHQDIVSDRLRCLYDLSFKENLCIIASAQTLVHRISPTEYVKTKSLFAKVGQTIHREPFYESLVASGYLRVDTVYQHGEFAVRGALLDIFPMGSDEAYRIEFFDDDIESLRKFDPDTQRTTEQVEQIELLPARECPLDSDAIALFREQWHARFDVDHRACTLYQDISTGIAPAGIEYYLPLFFEHTATLLNYLPENSTLFCYEGLENAIEQYWREITTRHSSRCGDITRPIMSPETIFTPVNEFFSDLKQFSRIDIIKEHSERNGSHSFELEHLPNISVDTKATQPLHRLADFLHKTQQRVLFCAESEGRREVLFEQLGKISVHPKLLQSSAEFLHGNDPVAIVVADIHTGINSPGDQCVLINENMLYGNRVQQARRRKKTQDDTDNIVKNLSELKIGSAVVHLEHGVGRYLGLQTIQHGDMAEEFLVLEYANDAKLYVPVASLHLISRYSASEEAAIHLHRLGTDHWQKAKRKASEKIRDVAAELLNIYALRQARKGFSHHIDDDSYERFSSEFPFEETPDQTSAIEAVRNDMLSPQPMDRLVCGDVGFGKTEVAMRAAFIAVQNSKQIAILVPTTLLAQQHYENFCDRFANWPITIEVISRFRSSKETNSVLEKVSQGHVDIIIGTHKLLSGSIEFKNLGLVIIDEEHRFGVRQKESLKSIRAEVDILNLTATPIPRTLNMAMSGMRDLSIIATPPAKRLSVKTFVRENDKNLIKEAILREIMRGGQVYYLHNEVKNIDKKAADLSELVPEARVQVGHGQMRERELESVMSDFYHKRFNILVCTTIIETGIDVPSANTIIIERADKFGLAQLHQLRGRVGRSHHQAYAYLLTPHKRAMTADAIKRLDAIEDAQDLGAGFTLASHDLEIRGAGELLGDEQSGQMQAIGFTLYMDMLDRAVKAIQSGKEIDLEKPFEHETEINLRIPALIPEDYLPDVSLRLSLYKRVSSAQNSHELESLQVEMIDRFGLLPDALKNLFRLTNIRFKAEDLGIIKIEANAQGGKLEFAKETHIEPLALVKLVQNQPQNYKLAGASQLQFMLASDNADTRLRNVNNLLDQLGKTA